MDDNSIHCPNCRTDVRFPDDSAGRLVPCPSCGVPTRIPVGDMSPTRVASNTETETYAVESSRVSDPPPIVSLITRDVAPHGTTVDLAEPVDASDADGRAGEESEIDSYPLGQPEKQLPVVRSFLLLQAQLTPEFLNLPTYETDDPPKHVFFSHVFDFPWRRPAFYHAVSLGVGLGAIAILLTCVAMASLRSPLSTGVALAVVCLPGVPLLMVTIPYATALVLTVVEDTAAGSRKLVGWGMRHWSEWLFETFLVTYVVVLSCSLAWLIGIPIALATGYFWLPWMCLVYLLFPVLLLSALGADMVIIPANVGVLQSLVRLPRAWAEFYLACLVPTGLVAMCVGSVLAVYRFPNQVPAVLESISQTAGIDTIMFMLAASSGPLIAWALLVQSRLIGRMGWLISGLDVRSPDVRDGIETGDDFDTSGGQTASPERETAESAIDS